MAILSLPILAFLVWRLIPQRHSAGDSWNSFYIFEIRDHESDRPSIELIRELELEEYPDGLKEVIASRPVTSMLGVVMSRTVHHYGRWPFSGQVWARWYPELIVTGESGREVWARGNPPTFADLEGMLVNTIREVALNEVVGRFGGRVGANDLQSDGSGGCFVLVPTPFAGGEILHGLFYLTLLLGSFALFLWSVAKTETID